MPFQRIAGRSDGVFWWFPALSEDQEKKLSNSPKLSCGFNLYVCIKYYNVKIVSSTWSAFQGASFVFSFWFINDNVLLN